MSPRSGGEGLECSRCLLTSDDLRQFQLSSEGICNYCQQFMIYRTRCMEKTGDRKEALAKILDKIRNTRKKGKYDGVLGVSGGVDSTYLSLLCHRWGLQPLLVHLDNGWNSEIAVQNIQRIVERLGFDLHTHVIQWEEFRDLQLAYLKASVVDVEIPTDHAIFALLYRTALERGIHFHFSGVNLTTEGFLPYDWTFRKSDSFNLLDIHRQFGSRPLKTFPLMDPALKKKIRRIGLETVEILDLLDYDKEKAKEEIRRELGWRDYGGKHYESVWTRFYQGHILPTKFGIDKRKAHLSNLILTGQKTRAEAKAELERPAYPPEQLAEDYPFVLKKLGLSEPEFRELMNRPIRSHFEFATEGGIFLKFPWLEPLRPLWKGLRRWLRQGLPSPGLLQAAETFSH